MVCVPLKSCDAIALYTTYITVHKFENTATFRVVTLIFMEEKY